MPPIAYGSHRAGTREAVAMFVVVFFYRCAADFQKLLHNVSSLAKKEDISVFETQLSLLVYY